MRLYHIRYINARYVSRPHVHRYTCMCVCMCACVYVWNTCLWSRRTRWLHARIESLKVRSTGVSNTFVLFFPPFLSSQQKSCLQSVTGWSPWPRSSVSYRDRAYLDRRLPGLLLPFSLAPIPWSTTSHPPPPGVYTGRWPYVTRVSMYSPVTHYFFSVYRRAMTIDRRGEWLLHALLPPIDSLSVVATSREVAGLAD